MHARSRRLQQLANFVGHHGTAARSPSAAKLGVARSCSTVSNRYTGSGHKILIVLIVWGGRGSAYASYRYNWSRRIFFDFLSISWTLVFIEGANGPPSGPSSY